MAQDLETEVEIKLSFLKKYIYLFLYRKQNVGLSIIKSAVFLVQ